MIIPHIKLLNYRDNLYFVYDVNCNEVLKVSVETYRALLNGKMENKTDEIDSLMESGYLQCKYPQKIEQPYKNYITEFSQTRINGLVLQVTQNCNLRCKYCAYSMNGILDRHHAIKNMDLKIAKQAIDFLCENSKALSRVRISFYGGEPMLNMDLISKCVVYAKQVMPYKNISFAMTTNLSLLTDEIIRFLINHDFKLTVSLDGPKEINDENRFLGINGDGSYDTVYKNLMKLKEHSDYYKSNVQINAVVDKSIDVYSIFDYFNSPELCDVTKSYSIVDDSKLKIRFATSTNFLKSLKNNNIKACIEEILGIDKEQEFTNTSFSNIKKRTVPFSLQPKVHHNGPCMPGIKKLFVNVDGDFYPCEKASGTSHHLIIGNVNTGLDLNKVETIYNLGSLSEDNCKKCWAIRLCNCCAINIDDGCQLSAKHKADYCNNQKKQLEQELLQHALITIIKQL